MYTFAQRLTIDKLHRDEAQAVGGADFVNVSDVRVIERGRGLRFLNEAAHPALISSQGDGQHLQRDFTMELRVFRKIDLAHTTRAKWFNDFVTADSLAAS